MVIRLIIIIVTLIATTVLLTNCSINKRGGTIPVYLDEFVFTTEERRFQLAQEIIGQIIAFQNSYECKNDSIIYNATAIVNVENEILTIYIPCLQREFNTNDLVKISPIELAELEYTTHEIYHPFPKESKNYPKWECISCYYKNTFGEIEIIN